MCLFSFCQEIEKIHQKTNIYFWSDLSCLRDWLHWLSLGVSQKYLHSGHHGILVLKSFIRISHYFEIISQMYSFEEVMDDFLFFFYLLTKWKRHFFKINLYRNFACFCMFFFTLKPSIYEVVDHELQIYYNLNF